MIVRGELIPIADSELDLERRLVPAHVKEHLLFPLRVERVPDDACSENLLSKRHDDEGVHVPTRSSHCSQSQTHDR